MFDHDLQPAEIYSNRNSEVDEDSSFRLFFEIVVIGQDAMKKSNMC